MASRIVIDGNAFYEIDEDCIRWKREQQRKRQEEQKREQAREQKREQQK